MRNEGERLAMLETEMKNIDTRMATLDQSVQSLHGKFDNLSMMLSQNYVAKETFEEWKKNRWLERIIIILITAILSGLIAFFLRENKF